MELRDSDPSPIVELESADVSLGGLPVLRAVDFRLTRGETIGVVGPNGSGKTTLVRAIATLLPIQAGAGKVLGARLGSDVAREIRTRIGLIGHQPTLIGELTLEENLVHTARIAGIDEKRVARALEVVGLNRAADRRGSACSFGMQRRAEIARLLIARPELLLLDEAASGLDEAAQNLIDALLAGVRERGGGSVVVSHDRRQLEGRCDSILTINGGKLSR